jgi:UTP--glucose-1-phosphate uridylyltransferase
MEGKKPAIGQLIEVYEKFGKPVAAIEAVPKEAVSRYGVIGGQQIKKGLWQANQFVEKPAPKEAPSNLAIIGRYVITPEIINLLRKQKPGKDGEIRLADAFITYLKSGEPIYGCETGSTRYDCGNKLGFLKAQVELGLKHPDIGLAFKKYLKTICQ